MKCDELKPLVFCISDLAYVDEPTAQPNFQNPHDHAVYKATEVDKVLAKKDTEIRMLRMALYKACANWAKCEELINNRDAYDASEYLPSAEDKFRKNAERWGEMATKCLKKAEEYR